VSRLAATAALDEHSFNALAEEPFTRTRMIDALGAGEPAALPELAGRLRRLRRQCLLSLTGRDLSGRANLQEVITTMTALAEVTATHACAAIAREMEARYGTPIGEETGTAQPLLVVGMGKLGGAELNVSSDIDLVFVYPEEGETRGPHAISNHEYFVRFGRKLIALLNDSTADGFVFRVDMRLRPYGDSGPLACSMAALEEYFITQGREWERYAWIKGRIIARSPVAGSGAGGDAQARAPALALPEATDPRSDDDQDRALAAVVQPFVYRRHLDFSAITSMRELSEQIRREVQRRDMSDNIKLGAGGIRQVEFIAQVHQLIRGGRDPGLRVRPTLDALQELGERHILEPQEVTTLAGSYDLLRRIEHRLQYLDDAQTHALPIDPEDRLRIARSMGCADWPTFSTRLDAVRAAVSALFERVCAISPAADAAHPLAPLWAGEMSPQEAVQSLTAAGFRDAQRAAARIESLRSSAGVRRMAASSQARLAQLLPRVIEVAALRGDPEATLERLLDIVTSIGRRESYLALLVEHPPVLERLARLAAASPWASGYLARQPILLDELLDMRALHAPPAWPRLLADLRSHLDATVGNVERQLDILRHFKHSQLFRIVVQDLAGDLLLEVVSDRLSELADHVLAETLARCWKHLNPQVDDLAAPCFAIIGFGKLGGKEMGYGSDLDLAFIYDDAPGAGSADDAPETYARLAMRVNSWLSTMTAAGVLYATDLRLRPDGAAGLLVSSISAFEQYQRDKAWVWEHQALTRARAVTGDPVLCARFERLRAGILRLPRDPDTLRGEVRAMRQRMREARRATDDPACFDIKHGRGGLIDLEFVVQFLVLAHAQQVRELTGNVGNLALLNVAVRSGLIDAALADAAQVAYRTLRRTQHQLQLTGADPARAPAAPLLGHARAIRALWQAVLGED
jgi:[glutamine synthetase] adenylyltransferase / [glutamine synthetase]-adenylyl-L-tyrosine phosphorylase